MKNIFRWNIIADKKIKTTLKFETYFNMVSLFLKNLSLQFRIFTKITYYYISKITYTFNGLQFDKNFLMQIVDIILRNITRWSFKLEVLYFFVKKYKSKIFRKNLEASLRIYMSRNSNITLLRRISYCSYANFALIVINNDIFW